MLFFMVLFQLRKQEEDLKLEDEVYFVYKYIIFFYIDLIVGIFS